MFYMSWNYWPSTAQLELVLKFDTIIALYYHYIKGIMNYNIYTRTGSFTCDVFQKKVFVKCILQRPCGDFYVKDHVVTFMGSEHFAGDREANMGYKGTHQHQVGAVRDLCLCRLQQDCLTVVIVSYICSTCTLTLFTRITNCTISSP